MQRETAAVDAAGALTFNPAFAMSPAESRSPSGSPARRGVPPASAAATPMIGLVTPAAAPDADACAAAERGLRARSLFQEPPPGGEPATPGGPAAPAALGGLPRLPLTPGTARRLRRPAGGRRKENAPANARSAAPRADAPSPGKRARAGHQASPAAPTLPPPGLTDSPAPARVTPDSGMLRTAAAAALSLDASRSGGGAPAPAGAAGGGGLPLSPLRPAAGRLARAATAPAATPERPPLAEQAGAPGAEMAAAVCSAAAERSP